MPKGSPHPPTKKASRNKGKKGKKKKPSASPQRHPVPVERAKQVPMPRSISPAATPIARLQQVTPQYPYVSAELKRIGIIAGPIIFLLIILALVL